MFSLLIGIECAAEIRVVNWVRLIYLWEQVFLS